MKLLLLVLLVLLLLVYSDPFRVGATPVLLVPSPAFSPNSPVSATMAAPTVAYSPGVGEAGQRHSMDSHRKILIALIVACTTLGAIISSLLGLWIYHCKCSRKPHRRTGRSSDGEKGLSLNPFFAQFNSSRMIGKKGSVSLVDYKLLEKGTENFRESNILGVGGFGRVYRAQMDDNLIVAVKKIECQSHDAEKEFQNEVDLLSRIQHPNIISLLGCCSQGDARFIVYELMQNGSLETQLHGPSHGSALTWHMRMKIALDTARGLEYLHEHCHPSVIHRDLKTSNILLDANFNAKLSDFGLAVADGTQNKNNIKLSGTLGYVAPEYLLDGKLTDKSDVYAFGVVLLELLLGRRPVEKLAPAQCQSIVTWAMPQLTDRSKLPNIVDPVIKDTMDLKHLYQVAAVAVLCVQPEPSYRPLITDVLHSLIPLVPVELGGTLRVTQLVVSVGSAVHSDH
ncbi:probable receptor-like protein kinase At1g80640 [Humulus lupulus]|uniref:probable receptor-like protein kinase At1g80640 n=1 Tax=Humulus lupulus TaxID=3486 RepID=UPI002B4106B2|nr:probable receptor-like protein kinase At1g80640 [Humulus lupulus]